MDIAKFLLGIALMVLNFAIATAIPFYFSQLPVNTIEMIQAFIFIIALISVVAGTVDK